MLWIRSVAVAVRECNINPRSLYKKLVDALMILSYGEVFDILNDDVTLL